MRRAREESQNEPLSTEQSGTGCLTVPGGSGCPSAQSKAAYLSVGVLVVLLIPRVVVLLDKAKILLTLPLQG